MGYNDDFLSFVEVSLDFSVMILVVGLNVPFSNLICHCMDCFKYLETNINGLSSWDKLG